jgi:hypothetical protein
MARLAVTMQWERLDRERPRGKWSWFNEKAIHDRRRIGLPRSRRHEYCLSGRWARLQNWLHRTKSLRSCRHRRLLGVAVGHSVHRSANRIAAASRARQQQSHPAADEVSFSFAGTALRHAARGARRLSAARSTASELLAAKRLPSQSVLSRFLTGFRSAGANLAFFDRLGGLE